MKLIKTASESIIRMSKSEWESIGKTAGWIRSPEEISQLKSSKKEAVKLADEIKTKLEEMGYTVPKINIKDRVIIKNVTDGDGRCHNCDIELKPWANKNNNKYELRSGIIIMAGPYAHKRFKRKRFSPKNVDKMLKFLQKIFKYTIDMENLRKRRSEKAEQARAEKFEAAMQNKIT